MSLLCIVRSDTVISFPHGAMTEIEAEGKLSDFKRLDFNSYLTIHTLLNSILEHHILKAQIEKSSQNPSALG